MNNFNKDYPYIENGTLKAFAKEIVCKLERNNGLGRGLELIGLLSLMIQEESAKFCNHVWMAIPSQIESRLCESGHLPPSPTDIIAVCKYCGVFK